MDFGTILAPALGPIIAPAVNLVVGFLVAVLIQAAKKIDAVPLQDGQKQAIRVTALVLSALAALATNAASGNLAAFDYESVVRPLVDTAVNLLLATGVYKLALKK